jgi:hypothetical protein
MVVSIGRTVDGLLAGRSLDVKELIVDEFAIRVNYEIRPPIRERPTSRENTWMLCGTDDLGNEYASAGGAFGTSRDGTCTEGVHSLVPTPHREASYINLGFLACEDLEEKPRQVIRVQLR